MIKKFLLYCLRWQLSTPILALCMYYMAFNVTIKTILANAIGACIFFWIDRYIFKSKILNVLWEIKEEIKCVDCRKIATGYRIVKTQNYDRLQDKMPEFRCKECSDKKKEELIKRGIKL